MVEFISADDPMDSRRAGPVAFARKVYEGAKRAKEMEEDVRVSGELASVTIENNRFGGFQIKIGFHENKMDEDFVFRGSQPMSIDPDSQVAETATTIRGVSNDVGQLARILRQVFDLNPWEFASLEAASIGGTGGLTDYEFTYETAAANGPPDQSTFDSRIESATRAPSERMSFEEV